MVRLLAVVLVSVFVVPQTFGAGPAPSAKPAEQLLQYLNHTVDWYRRVSTLDQGSLDTQEVLYRDSVRENSRKSLRLAFEFARAQAPLLADQSTGASSAAGKDDHSAKRAQGLATATQQVQRLQTQLNQSNQDLPHAALDAQPLLTAQRDKLAAQLSLAQARLEGMQNLQQLVSGPDVSAADALLQEINNLESSLPDAQSNDTTPAKPPGTTVVQTPARPESTGVLGLFSEMLTLSSRMGELKALADQAGKLSEYNQKLHDPIRTEWRDAAQRGDALAATTQQSADAQKLTAQSQELQQLAARIKAIGSAGVPLSAQGVALNATRATLLEWHAALGKQYTRALRSLLVRVGAMVITIFVLLMISKLWSRATYRYVTDPRRRIQLLLIRRVVVGVVIAIVIIAGVVTEYSSLATFAGIITAGIAVALQSVILSGAAYFFFIGRYGVRIGDRVTISGITGDVVETGLFRLYMMELGGSGRDLNPTGRIVVFSNSVLFQNSFYKQMPGADYTWNEVALTLSPDSDYKLAEQRLLGAVESVFNEYKQSIETQFAQVQQSMHLLMPTPRPEGRLRFVDAGLEFVVRYPVEIRRATETNDKITRKLLETIDQEPKLRLVSSGTPKIQAA